MLKDNVLLNTKLETSEWVSECLVRLYLNISDTRPKTKNIDSAILRLYF